uniref:NADH-ubiquinone oxidoreductase chain 3 n=1 Tax=Scymninae sp. 4 ACP-2013 TaxID=1434585 RepID=A0A3G3FX02_9CUCU|nr:NADH dehydrogenase subunit 3 [Scymninae sp. 4 ACP-2013]
MILTLMIFMMIIFFIINIVMMIINFISKKTFKDREKNSPFECGFDPKNSARLPFSLQFFLITLIFLIFDIEITLIIPFLFTMNLTNLMNYSMIIFLFIFILLIGLYHEWNKGALNWKI